MTQRPQTPSVREQLEIVYCPVCKVDTMRADSGICLFCDTRIYTPAEQTERARKQHADKEYRRRRRAENRARRTCGGCGVQIDQINHACNTCKGRHRRRRERDTGLYVDGRVTNHGHSFIAATLGLFPDLGTIPSSAAGPAPREGGIHSQDGPVGRHLLPVKSASDSTRQPRSRNA